MFKGGKGCFQLATPASSGYYNLRGLSNSPTAPILIQNASPDKKDIFSLNPCFGGKRIFSSFGKAFGTLKIDGEILLGPSGSFNQGEATLNDWFEGQRSSNSQKPATVSTGAGATYSFYPVHLSTQVVSNEFHILGFSITGVLIDTN